MDSISRGGHGDAQMTQATGGSSATLGPVGAPMARRPAPGADEFLGPRRRASDNLSEPAHKDEVAHRDAVYRRSLGIADLISAVAAIGVTGALVDSQYLAASSLAALPVVALAAKMIGLYDRDELVLHKTTLNEAPALFHLATLVTLVLAVVEAGLSDSPLSAGGMVGLWAALLLAFPCFRAAARRLARAMTIAEKCVLVGDVQHADRVKRMLQANPQLGAELVALIPFNRVTARGETAEAFARYLTKSEYHRVIITHTDDQSGDMLETIRLFKSAGIKVSVLPGLFDVLGSAVEFDDISGSTLLGVRSYGLSRSSRLLKRSMDITLAGLGLVLLAPLFGVIALAIRLESEGPVFFRQARVGRGGRGFRILKFRTMRTGADRLKAELRSQRGADGLFKLENDPRVTRVGRLLRSTSLDELPQLLNVVRGEMSLVGPRPLVFDEDAQVNGWRRQRLDLTPGMTGVWQVLPSLRLPLEEMVALDYLYIVNWSLWADVQIMLRTIPHVLGRRGL
jgi:exopolysaccharide biosynthesis polyprenyl glycosylphosphotransferase